jgi:hypothetical protein
MHTPLQTDCPTGQHPFTPSCWGYGQVIVVQLQLASAVCVKGLHPQLDKYVATTVAVWLLKFVAVAVTK